MEKNATVYNEKLPFKVKLAFGLSGYYSFITWTAFSYYGLYFFTDCGWPLGCIRRSNDFNRTLWDAITDPIVGGISDNLKCNTEEDVAYHRCSSSLRCYQHIIVYKLGIRGSAAKVYFVIMILLYYTAQTVLDISSSALGSEMTIDYDERSALATYKNYFGLLATVAISPTLVLVANFSGFFENPDFGWSCTLALYTSVALIFVIILWRTTRGYERNRGDATNFSVADLKELFKNKAARYVALIFAIGIFSNTINYSIQVYYFTEYAQLTGGQIATVTFVFGVASIIGAWVCERLMMNLDKKLAWVISIGLEGLVLVAMVGLFIQPAQIGMIYALVILMAVGNAAIYQVPWAMIPDCVDVMELSSGKRIDGIVFGIIAFLQKASGALGAALLGIFLTIIGYYGADQPAPETIEELRIYSDSGWRTLSCYSSYRIEISAQQEKA